jgi:hypothetical protein
MIYMLTAIGLSPGGSSSVHIYTQTVHRTTQLTQTIHRTTQLTQTIHRTTQLTQTIHRTTQLTQTIHRTTQKLGRVRAVPRLCRFYPGICLTTEEKSRKNLSQGSHT